ncbi:CopG family transcriptional regulator [Nitrosomonas sp. Nm166]|uniref:ribbon-helix-helix domain-containing protein n=1 Tax=Nitrosomonas sp. Nm166 TaxID=1881054 RepID=UPI0008E1577D|nr:CopG family transcriptional regulator [Nitrosomonas sp. Nm166]SFF01695.1 Ribbon-helix-helix protein, copG family [Nitrosomonas sp. Nm166]
MTNTTFSNQRSSTLPVVLPISWIERLTQLARERGINRSALVREALQQTLFAEDKTAPKDIEEV